MNYAYNITFVILPQKEEAFFDWLKKSALTLMFPPGCGVAQVPEIRKVVEAGGQAPAPEDGLSIAVQAGFDSKTDAHRWHDCHLPAALRDFNCTFAPECAFFTTLLDVTPCDSL